jgi:hypothetical protein
MQRSKRLGVAPGGASPSREHDLKVFGSDTDPSVKPSPAEIRVKTERVTGRQVALVYYYQSSDALRPDGTCRVQGGRESAPGFVEVEVPIPDGHRLTRASGLELAPAFAP